MKRTALITLLVTLTTMAACSPVDALNATIPRDGYSVSRDIAYGPDPRQKLDVYMPDNAKNAPVILFFYGGSWQMGSKDDYRFLGQAFASKGYITAIADYRLYPEVYYPTFVEDGALALRYVHSHAADYQGDPNKLIIAGHSAGAFNAMMLSADDQFHRGAGSKRSWIRGTVALSGPYDFLPFTDKNIKALFSKYPDAQTQPINHITGKMAPVFLATGDKDDTVDPRNSHRVKAKLEALHSPVEEHVYPGIDHITIMLALANGFQDRAPLLDDIAIFINKTVSEKSSSSKKSAHGA